MKSRDFGLVLKAFADVLAAACAPEARNQILGLAGVFDVMPNATVAAVIKRLSSLPLAGATGNPSLGDVVRLLAPLKELVGKAGKASAAGDIGAVKMLLEDNASIRIDAFVTLASEALAARPAKKQVGAGGAAGQEMRPRRMAGALREDLVSSYNFELTALLGDETGFASAFHRLQADQAMGKADLAELAKRMTGAPVRSKVDALKKIWNRHQSLLTFKAKSNATGGRSAA